MAYYSLESNGVRVHVDDRRVYTTVVIKNGTFVAIGTSKRNPSDEFQFNVGVCLAKARAYREMADILEQHAMGGATI